MTTEITKINQFKTFGDELVVSMTSEIVDIQKGLEEKYPVSKIPADLSVKENYELVKSAIKDIKKPRIALEKDRKSISSVPYNLCKKINSAAKPIRESLVALEESWKETKIAYDEKVEREKFEKAKADAERIEKITERIESIKMAPIVNMDKTSTELQPILDAMQSGRPDLSWAMEHEESASGIVDATIERLETLIGAKQAQEEADRKQKEEADRLAAEKKAAEAKAQVDREEQDRKNKVEADRLAEQDRVAKVEADLLAKEREEFEEEKRVAQEKEDARLAAVKKEEDEKAERLRVAREAKIKEDAKKEQDRLDAIKKEEDEKAAKLKAEQEQKEAEAKAKEEEAEAKKKALLDAENLSLRMDEAAVCISVILDGGGQPLDIVSAIIDDKVLHVTFGS